MVDQQQHSAVGQPAAKCLKRDRPGQLDQQAQIGCVARQRTRYRQRAVMRVASRQQRMIVTLLGDEAPGPLMPPDTAEMRGYPDRTADVGTEFAGYHATRHGCSRTAR